MLLDALGGRDQFSSFQTELIRFDREDPQTQAQATSHLVISVTHPDRAMVGRRFSNAVVELYLAGYPGCYLATPPGDASQMGVYWPTTVGAASVPTLMLTTWDGVEAVVPATPVGPSVQPASAATSPIAAGPIAAGPIAAGPTTGGSTVPLPLGRLFGARSGDKGGNANVGLWARDDAAYDWLRGFLDAERFVELFPETAGFPVARYDLPRLRAVNFVVTGLLGAGVASSGRMDPQAKALGEFVRARVVAVPAELAKRAG
jgi:hypothetical protein